MATTPFGELWLVGYEHVPLGLMFVRHKKSPPAKTIVSPTMSAQARPVIAQQPISEIDGTFPAWGNLVDRDPCRESVVAPLLRLNFGKACGLYPFAWGCWATDPTAAISRRPTGNNGIWSQNTTAEYHDIPEHSSDELFIKFITIWNTKRITILRRSQYQVSLHP